jgi:hypothetical protein
MGSIKGGNKPKIVSETAQSVDWARSRGITFRGTSVAPTASLPATRVQFGLGAVLPARNASRSDAGGQHSNTPTLDHSITPSLRAAGFEDDDEDENDDAD